MFDFATDFVDTAVKTAFAPDAKMKEQLMEEMKDTKMPAFFDIVEKKLQENG